MFLKLNTFLNAFDIYHFFDLERTQQDRLTKIVSNWFIIYNFWELFTKLYQV
jgi:hypothetical protein